MSVFEYRSFAVATMHEKEKVLGPILAQAFGMKCLDLNLNTDLFGTFSGEVERTDSPIDTARKKCDAAYQASGIDLVLASEGSFGPHPSHAFLPCNEETLLLKDYKNHLEIAVRSISLKTNFASLDAAKEDDLPSFLQQTKFPNHALIVKKAAQAHPEMVKGITNEALLFETIAQFKQQFGSFYLETDMRAMYNPTRMAHIAELGQKLVEQMKSTCPACNCPGFSVSDIVRGLPCENCFRPTEGVLQHVYLCQKCKKSQIVDLPNGKAYEDPMYCDFCNP